MMSDNRIRRKKLTPSTFHYITVALTVIAMIISLYLIFIWSKIERIMGPVQKIFYFHVASAWNAFFAFFIFFIFIAAKNTALY